jgi:manganese efflux pump family protein
MKTLLVLAFVLSLDSFRASLGLGALKLSLARRAQLVASFGLCDGLAPLLGLLVGKSIVAYVGPWAEHVGPLLLCVYGAYVIYVARSCAGQEAAEESGWIVFGLPLTLSLDNLVAGASLGMTGFPLLLSILVIGAMSSLMSATGLLLAGTAVSRLKLKSELLGGLALVLVGITLTLENLWSL